MNFFTQLRGRSVQVLAVADRPYAQAPLEIEILSITADDGRQVETSPDELRKIRNLAYEQTNH